MTAAASFDSLLAEALRLPVEDRSRMASRLIASVDDDIADVSPAWREEIARRMESVRNGTARLIPHEEVMAAARQQLADIRTARA